MRRDTPRSHLDIVFYVINNSAFGIRKKTFEFGTVIKFFDGQYSVRNWNTVSIDRSSV